MGDVVAVYLDNAATTRCLPEIERAVAQALLDTFGNPSSIHAAGLAAERRIEAARARLATAIGARTAEIVFTSGGTEANNLALKGAATALAGRGRHIITTPIEHASVREPLERLAGQGFSVSYADVDACGRIDPDQLCSLVRDDTVLVSIGLVNNEIGTVQKVAEIAARLRRRKRPPLLHTDAVQALGKVALDVEQLGCDLLSVSAHKIHGPKGTGALYVRRGVRLVPLVDGGGQEHGVRPGTQNVPGIVGFDAALTPAMESFAQRTAHYRALKTGLWDELVARIPGVTLNGAPVGESAPHILNVSFPNVRGEVLVRALAGHDIYVSTGSACASHRTEPSHVLQALVRAGRTPASDVLDGSLRMSFGAFNALAELPIVAQQIAACVHDLQALAEP